MDQKRSKFLKISSHDAIISQSKSDSDFVVGINSNILQKVVGVKVRSVAFRNTFDNITAHNGRFVFEIQGIGNAFFDLGTGFYTAAELTSLVESLLKVSDVSMAATTVSLDPTTNKVVINSPVPIRWQPNDRSTDSNPVAELLGFSPYQTDYNTYNTTHTANGYVKLAGPIALNIYSRALSENSYIDADSKNLLNILTSIPIHAPFGTTELYESSLDRGDLIKYKSPRPLNTIDIRLRDNRGKSLDYNDELVIVLQIFY